jgi:hypothetical protein
MEALQINFKGAGICFISGNIAIHLYFAHAKANAATFKAIVHVKVLIQKFALYNKDGAVNVPRKAQQAYKYYQYFPASHY